MNYFFQSRHHAAVAVVEADPQRAVTAFRRIDDRLATNFVGGHRLLGDHGQAPLQALDDEFVVGRIDGGDDQRIEVGLVEHPVEIGVTRTIGSDDAGREIEAAGIDVRQAGIGHHVAVILEQVSAPEPCSTDAGADQSDPVRTAAVCAEQWRGGGETGARGAEDEFSAGDGIAVHAGFSRPEVSLRRVCR